MYFDFCRLISATLGSRNGCTFSAPTSIRGHNILLQLEPTMTVLLKMARFMSQTVAIIAFRSSFPNQDIHPSAKAMLKLYLTAGRACNSSRQTLHGVIAFTGLSIVAMTLIIIAWMRSDVSNALLLKASLALLRASLNLSFASSRSVVSWRALWRGILLLLELKLRIVSLLRLTLKLQLVLLYCRLAAKSSRISLGELTEVYVFSAERDFLHKFMWFT